MIAVSPIYEPEWNLDKVESRMACGWHLSTLSLTADTCQWPLHVISSQIYSYLSVHLLTEALHDCTRRTNCTRVRNGRQTLGNGQKSSAAIFRVFNTRCEEPSGCIFYPASSRTTGESATGVIYASAHV